MDKEALGKRVEEEAAKALIRYREHDAFAGSSDAAQRACWAETIRPLVERIVELEEGLDALAADVERMKGERDRAIKVNNENRAVLNAEIDRLEAQSKADAEHRATLAQEVIDLNTALEEADRRLKASEARAEMYRAAFIGACHLFAAEEARSS